MVIIGSRAHNKNWKKGVCRFKVDRIIDHVSKPNMTTGNGLGIEVYCLMNRWFLSQDFYTNWSIMGSWQVYTTQWEDDVGQAKKKASLVYP